MLGVVILHMIMLRLMAITGLDMKGSFKMKFKYLLLVLVMALAFVMTGCEEKKLSGTSFDDTTEEASDAGVSGFTRSNCLCEESQSNRS